MKYEGDFFNDEIHGSGTKTMKNGHVVTGEFKNGYANGQAIYMWPHGAYYEGQMKDGVRNGKGNFRCKTGCCEYDGDWVNDERHGIGYTLKDGKTGKARWEKDEFVEWI